VRCESAPHRRKRGNEVPELGRLVRLMHETSSRRRYQEATSLLLIGTLAACAVNEDRTASSDTTAVSNKCFATVQEVRLHPLLECKATGMSGDKPASVCHVLEDASRQTGDPILPPGQRMTVFKVFRFSTDSFFEGTVWVAFARLSGGPYDGTTVEVNDGLTYTGPVRFAPDMYVPCTSEPRTGLGKNP
jgi:hypothetical protein